ncbi:hypothetical protein V5735_23860 (plasmid) [Haladaptatus sp. SPP-AMP-3]|uniref:hypothetical protein n=1 Tax=Haladaptatus sp. SPP-AMP-3 TaxID=3121295 RepID=UPI003C305688
MLYAKPAGVSCTSHSNPRHFEALDSLQQQPIDEMETQEDIWTLKGQKTSNDRVTQRISNANNRIIFGARDPIILDDNVVTALSKAQADGIDVFITSGNPAVCELFEERGLEACQFPMKLEDNDRSGRILAIGSDVILMSVLVPTHDRTQNEVAFWSDGTVVCQFLIGLLET